MFAVVAEITSVAEVWMKHRRGRQTAENNYFYGYMSRSIKASANAWMGKV